MGCWDFIEETSKETRLDGLKAEYPLEGSGPITLVQSAFLQTFYCYIFVFPKFDWDFIVKFFNSYVKSYGKPWTKKSIMLRFSPGTVDEALYSKQGEIEGVEIWKEDLLKSL